MIVVHCVARLGAIEGGISEASRYNMDAVSLSFIISDPKR